MFKIPALLAAAALSFGCANAKSTRPVTADSSDAQTARIMARLSALSADSMEGRQAGTQGGKRARAWLIRELSAIGVAPYGQSYEHVIKLPARPNADTLGANVVATVPGRNANGPVLVLSAHYDHVGIRNGQIYNGADDDASGVVALLTIAERLKQDPPEHEVVLAFFDAEEGGLRGARAFVSDEVVPLSRIALNINLDMVSRQDGKALWVAGLAHYPGLRSLAEGAAAQSAIPIRFGHDTASARPGDNWTNSSDHAAFHARGIPFLYLGVEDHADYHGPGDDWQKVDPAFYRGSIDFAYALVRAADRVLGEVTASGGK